MEDLLWSMKQESRALQELRSDIRGVWQDEAARELTGRYLDPHQTEDQTMLAGLEQQKEALDHADARLATATRHGQHAEEYALLVVDGLKSTGQELQNAYAAHDRFVQYNSEARGKIPQIYALINQANTAGGTD
jgi:hypothetical protein